MQAVMQHVVLNRATMGVADTTEVSGTEEKVMFDIAILGEPTELPLQLLEKVIPIPAAEPKKVKPICEPEERLRKLLAQTARIELFALILFLTIAVVGVVSCFAELFQLLDNDAIG
jgi:hypothetical protein